MGSIRRCLKFFFAEGNSWRCPYFVDDVCESGDGESDVSDEEESESNDDSSQSGEEEGESSEDDEVDRYLLAVFPIRSGLDPDSIRAVDPEPDPHSKSGSGSRRSKRSTKIEKFEKFHVLKCWMFSFEG